MPGGEDKDASIGLVQAGIVVLIPDGVEEPAVGVWGEGSWFGPTSQVVLRMLDEPVNDG